MEEHSTWSGGVRVVIKRGIVYEAIISMLDQGHPYATPVGFQINDDKLVVRFYKGYRTHELLEKTLNPVLNITRDPAVFFKAAFKAETGGLSLEDFIVDEVRGLVYLKNAEAHLVLKLKDIEDHEDYSLFRYEVLEERVNQLETLEPYTRCYSSLIELIIYASKVKAWRNLTSSERTEVLRGVESSTTTALKTCRDSSYMNLLRDLRELIESWLEQ